MTDFRNGLKYITTETGAAIDEITGSVGDSSGTCGEYVSTFFNNFFSLLKLGVTMVTAAVAAALKTIKAAIATAGTALIWQRAICYHSRSGRITLGCYQSED